MKTAKMHKVDTFLADGGAAVTGAAGAAVATDGNGLLVMVVGIVAPLVKDAVVKLVTAGFNALVLKLKKNKK